MKRDWVFWDSDFLHLSTKNYSK